MDQSLIVSERPAFLWCTGFRRVAAANKGSKCGPKFGCAVSVRARPDANVNRRILLNPTKETKGRPEAICDLPYFSLCGRITSSHGKSLLSRAKEYVRLTAFLCEGLNKIFNLRRRPHDNKCAGCHRGDWIIRRSRPIIAMVCAKKLSGRSAKSEVPDTVAPTHSTASLRSAQNLQSPPLN